MKNNLPRISIITPCYNSEATIEATLKSIHSQCYPNLEHIIMDGGSTDGTMKIIGKYEDQIYKVVSKKDKGQYFAIMEGFSYATGEIYCWLNADDISLPWSLQVIADVFAIKDVNWVSGISAFLNTKGVLKKVYNNSSAKNNKGIRNGWYSDMGYGYLQQESMFWSKSLWEAVGGLNCNYKLAADFDLWIKFAEKEELHSVDIPLSAFRIHSGSRSVRLVEKYYAEEKEIRKELKPLPFLFRLFGGSKIVKFVLRFITTKKTNLIYQRMNSDNWFSKKVRRPVTGINFYSLTLEK